MSLLKSRATSRSRGRRESESRADRSIVITRAPHPAHREVDDAGITMSKIPMRAFAAYGSVFPM
jgi:hypothetical protein